MPKRLLEKALKEVRTSKTSTRSLANNRALRHPEDTPGCTPPHQYITTAQDLQNFEGRHVTVVSPFFSLPNGRTYGYVHEGAVYSYAGVGLDEKGIPFVKIFPMPLPHVGELKAVSSSKTPTERTLIQKALEARAKGKKMLSLPLRLYS